MNRRTLSALILSLLLLLTGCAASTQAETTAATEMATEAAAEATEPIDLESVAVIPTEEPAPTEYIPMEALTVEGIAYPGEFGEVFLGADAVRSLRNAHTDYAAEQISHVGDALLYVAEKNPRDPKAGVQLFTALLEGDYPYVGHIEIVWDDNAWIVATVGLDGRYYAFDPFHPDMDWTTRPENGCSAISDLNTLSQNVIDSWEYPGTNLIRVKIATDIHTQLAISYPEFEGAVLGQEAVAALYRANNIQAAADAITTVADAYYYLECCGQQFQPNQTCAIFVQLLEGDFFYIGTIELRYQNNMSYSISYILQDGIYYAFDPFASFSRNVNQVESNWVVDPQSGCRSNEDLYALVDAAAEAFPYTDAELDQTIATLDVLDYILEHNPQLAGSVLGKEQVLALHAAGDESAAAEAITSIADALYYVRLQQLRTSEECCELLSQLLLGDCEASGSVDIATRYNHYWAFFLKQDGLYYAFDPYANYDWVLNPRNDCFSNADIQVLSDRLAQACPFLGRNETPTGTYQVFEQ